MLYRHIGQINTSYGMDSRLIPIREDRWFMAMLIVFMVAVVPLVASTYWLSVVLIPILILSLASLGLNILTGYAGQLSLGSAAFMAVGAFTAFNFMLRVEHINLLVAIFVGGLAAGVFGLICGLPAFESKAFI